MREEIKHAVVKAENGMMLLGKCHADCFYQGHNLGLKISSKADDQGFITNKGRYVNRKVAARIAKRAKQVRDDKNRPLKKIKYLMSEDIWYRRDIMYCQQRGYVQIVTAEAALR